MVSTATQTTSWAHSTHTAAASSPMIATSVNGAESEIPSAG